MANDRMDQINELVKREVAEILQRLFPDFIISVTEVTVSRDLSYAKIWISSLNKEDEIIKLCQKNGSVIRQELSKKIKLRKVPYLNFNLDVVEREASKIDKIFNQIKDYEHR